MSSWPSTKARKVRKALARLGWQEREGGRKSGSHVNLVHPELPDYTWSFGDNDEIGPKMLARIAKSTGLKPEDL